MDNKYTARITKYSDGKGLVGLGSLVIGGGFAIDVHVRERKSDGQLYVTYPQRKGKDKDGKDSYIETAHPITKEDYQAAIDAVLEAYKIAKPAKSQSGAADAPADAPADTPADTPADDGDITFS